MNTEKTQRPSKPRPGHGGCRPCDKPYPNQALRTIPTAHQRSGWAGHPVVQVMQPVRGMVEEVVLDVVEHVSPRRRPGTPKGLKGDLAIADVTQPFRQEGSSAGL